jgi:hypothetical protein
MTLFDSTALHPGFILPSLTVGCKLTCQFALVCALSYLALTDVRSLLSVILDGVQPLYYLRFIISFKLFVKAIISLAFSLNRPLFL